MFNVMNPSAGVGEDDFRNALGHFASGVTVITTLDPTGAVHGMTATAFSSLSMRPPLVLVAVARGTRCHKQLIANKKFGVSILHAEQVDLSRHFGGKPSADIVPRFETRGDAQVLSDAMVTLACTMEDAPLAGGDHSIFVGLVTDIVIRKGAPLIHFGGAYRSLSDK